MNYCITNYAAVVTVSSKLVALAVVLVAVIIKFIVLVVVLSRKPDGVFTVVILKPMMEEV